MAAAAWDCAPCSIRDTLSFLRDCGRILCKVLFSAAGDGDSSVFRSNSLLTLVQLELLLSDLLCRPGRNAPAASVASAAAAASLLLRPSNVLRRLEGREPRATGRCRSSAELSRSWLPAPKY